jgi:hypothetical protein
MSDIPADGDWIVCVQTHEGKTLREHYPRAKLQSTYLDGLRGQALSGKTFITPAAERSVNMDRLRDLVALCALTTGADPTIHRLDA